MGAEAEEIDGRHRPARGGGERAGESTATDIPEVQQYVPCNRQALCGLSRDGVTRARSRYRLTAWSVSLS